MSDVMSFPEMIQEFIADYAFKDRKEEYTNGAMLIPVFRVDQAIDHYFSKLESELSEKDKRIAELEVENARLVTDLHDTATGELSGCDTCAIDWDHCDSFRASDCKQWKWRGVREGAEK